jgi:hypothetical protein
MSSGNWWEQRYHITPLAIYQTHSMDATISWLSPARFDYYLHAQDINADQKTNQAIIIFFFGRLEP